MLILKIILGCIILLISPGLLGLIFTKFLKEKNNLFFSFVIGYVVEFSSFELIYVPMYFAEMSFKSVLWSWTILMIALVILSVILNYKEFKNIGKDTINILKKMPKILTTVFALLVFLQIIYPVKYMQIIDPDDAFYLATVNTTIDTNSLFKYNAYDGSEYSYMPLRYSLAGLCTYFGVTSELISIHPSIFMHTIWPAIIIPLEYIIYAGIAKKIFNGNKEKIGFFMIFLATIHIFGFISVFMNFSFFAYRSWQGKSLIANLIVPLIWLISLYCIEDRNKFINWLLLFLVMLSACFVTEMGVFLAPITLAILAIIHLFENKKFIDIFKYLICCIPQLIIGLLYIIGV